MKKLNQKGSAIAMLLVLLVAVALVAVGSFIYNSQEKNSDLSANNDTSTDSLTDVELVEHTAKMFDTTVSLTAPSNWVVEKGDDSAQFGGLPADSLTVKSPTGLSIKAFPNAGVGGNCDPRDDTFTLVGKIDSLDKSVTFVEYSISDGTSESFGAHKNPPVSVVGESANNSCQIGYIGIFDGAAIKVSDNGQPTTYDRVIKDAEFVEVLKSVSVTEI